MTGERDAVGEYLRALEKELDQLRPTDRAEVLREIEVHLHDSIDAREGPGQERVRDAIERLGSPSTVARAYSSERLLSRGSRGFRPRSVLAGLVLAFGGGSAMTLLGLIFSAGYAMLSIALVAVIGKLLVPESGLFLHPDGSWSLSFEAMAGSQEILGWWLIPIGIAVIIVGWLLLGRLLRLMLRLAMPGRCS